MLFVNNRNCILCLDAFGVPNMGVINFSIDHNLLKILKKNLSADIFIETGTFKGEILEVVKNHFKQIYSIELSHSLYKQAYDKFKNFPHIYILHGDSAETLKTLMLTLCNTPAVYWLNAHWCIASNTEGELSQCPLIRELNAIKHLHSDSVIMIDNARLFPHETSQWPSFNEVIAALQQLSETHNIMVVNDCILYFPTKIKSDIELYAHHYGIDWLSVLDKSRDYDNSVNLLREKEHILQSFIEGFHSYGHIKYLWKKLKLTLKPLLTPKLGRLNHHDPKPLFIPNYYNRKPKLARPPLISIVTPSFNQGIFLERTIKSILSQQYPNLEYIIQDGGSHDNTIEILERYSSSIKHWESKFDDGQSSAINLGFCHATGEIMAYLNSDDLLLPGSLHYISHYFEKHPHVDVVYGHRILIDENDHEIGRWTLPSHNSHVLSWADYIPQETLFWRRQIWEKVGGKIDKSFRFAMDWDLILRFRDAGAKFTRLPRFLGAFRVHAQQKTSAQISQIGMEEMKRIRLRYHQRELLPVEIKDATRMYLYRHLLNHFLYTLGLLRY